MRKMRAVLLYCTLALVCGGGLAKTFRDGLKKGNAFPDLARDPVPLNERRLEELRRAFSVADGAEETPKQTAAAETDDRARGIVDSFLKKVKTIENENGEPAAEGCGYMSCNVGKPGMLNVHLVPHTHDDVGWLQTVDEYFYGDGITGVQYILDTVLQQLFEDPKKRFIYVELAYFTRWWNELHDSTRHLVKGLVLEGRLEFILGGWCMNDEASTHYSSIIDQHTIGFKFLNDNFGACGRPRIGWQIDPFGHSREQASIFAQFGFDGLFFARLDYQDWNQRVNMKTLEHVWMGSESLGDQASLFTGVLYGGYGPPGGFCFQCGDTPIMDDERLENYNVKDRVDDFISTVRNQANAYTTNHIMLTMGSDFEYENARKEFKNLDKLIEHVNMRQVNGSNVNVFYSTPSCYVLGVNQAQKTYTKKEDDFFPYAHRDHSFWTGYFTSRPALKGYERSSNNFLQICKQLEVLALLGPRHGTTFKVNVLRHALGVLQHHDGVSGTERQHVAFDYARMVAEGVSSCQEVVNMSYAKLLPLSSSVSLPTVEFCPLANISYCPVSENNNKFVVVIYNPIGRESSHMTWIPVSGNSYVVKDAKQQIVDAQVVPLPVTASDIPEFKASKATGQLVFRAGLPALGYTTFFVQGSTDADDAAKSLSVVSAVGVDAADLTIKNEFLSLTFSGQTGFLQSLTNIGKSKTIMLSNQLRCYKSYAGNNDGGQNQASGAYIFRPNGTNSLPVASAATTSLVQGSVVQEVRQKFSSWASQVVRLYKGRPYVEIEWTVGPIPVDDKIGKEVISRFTTDLKNNGVFYTDANGREVLKRVRDYRPTWKLNQTEPVAGNYYPVNSRIFIQDVTKDLQLTIMTDRSQGGSSIVDGEVELMLHRRILNDDSLGVSEPLNEPGYDGKGLIVRGKYYIFLDTIKESVVLHRDSAQKIYMEPSVGFIQTSMTPDVYSKHFRTMWSGLKRSLPLNVHLLTLEHYQAGMFLLRLEHFYQKDESSVFSQVAKVELKDLFAPFTIVSVEEQTLGANQPLSKATRLQWNVQNYGRTTREMSSFVKPVDPVDLIVELKAMQIRTFHVTIKASDDDDSL